MDFVDFVSPREEENVEISTTAGEEPPDFFSFAGLWKSREVDLDLIRDKAWPRQYVMILCDTNILIEFYKNVGTLHAECKGLPVRSRLDVVSSAKLLISASILHFSNVWGC